MNELIIEKHEVQTLLKKRFSFLFDKGSLFYYVLTLILVGVAFFGYALFTQHFSTPFSGDYSQQAFAFYYNFYDDWWLFFKTGKFPMYDANTFIGADNILANTYYGLFSPFTLPILLFPREAIPQAMAIMSIAKLVCGGLLFRVYLKYLGCTERTARIFSIAYAFMGWMAYYLWFNTFYEVLAFLPLVLFGIEKVIKERKIWAVSLGFFLIGIGNYFFLLTIGLFGVIYAGFRFFQTSKERNAKQNINVVLLGILGFALGFAMCSVVVFPAILSSFGINRATSGKYWPLLKEAIIAKDLPTVFKMMFTYWNPNVANYSYEPSRYYFCYAFPLASYFFPTVSCRFVNIIHYTEFENAGSSIFFFTPCIILFLASFIRSIKNGKISHVLAFVVVLICLFVPFFYFLIGAFSNCYGRWEIIVPTIGLAYIALNFDHREEMSSKSILISGIVSFVTMIGVYFLARYIISVYGLKEGYQGAHIDGFGEVGGIIVYELILCGLETIILGKFWKKSFLPTIVNCLIIAEAVVMGNVVANMHYLQSTDNDVNGGISQLRIETDIVDSINKQDNSFFRLQSPSVNESHPNLPNAEGYNGISTFHTFYNNEVDDFVHMTQITCHDTSWSGLAFGKHANLDEFLGVKYYLTKDRDTSYNYFIGDKQYTYTFTPNVALNYEYQEQLSKNGYRVYKNKYQYDFGLSFDTLYYKHRNEKNPINNDFYKGSYYYSDFIRNEEALFSGAILNDDDLEEVNELYPEVFNIKTAPSMEAKTINTKRTVYGIYEENSWFNPFDPEKYIDEAHKIADISKTELPHNKLMLVYEPNNGQKYFEIGEHGGSYLFDYPTRQTWGTDYTAAVFLINEDNKVITFDDLQGYSNSNASGHMIRGLYSKERIKHIIVTPLGNAKAYVGSSPIYYEPWENVEQRYQNAIDYSLKNVKYSVNDFDFETNYEKERFVSTQVAYTKGWKVRATNELGVQKDLKVYNVQGGFAGFVAPKGYTKYHMYYVTDGVQLFFPVSLFATAVVIGSGVLVKIKKKNDSKLESSSKQ